MARNGSGTYSKVNTFVAGNTITAAGPNQNWDDLVAEMTNSVAADGQTPITGALKGANGTAAAPAYGFNSDPDTGTYRHGANELGFATGGTVAGYFDSTQALNLPVAPVVPAKSFAITKIADGTANRLYGTNGSGVATEVTPSTGLTLSAGTLTAVAQLPRGYIDGCILANGADATNDITFTAGVCRDSTNAVNITVAAMATGKQLDANWAPGDSAGMRNSAAGIANTTYHIYAVAKADGTQDIYAHTSTTVATVITALQAETGGGSYIYARLIGSIVRASAAIVAFTQYTDGFLLFTLTNLDVNNATPGTSANTGTFALVPTGFKARVLFNAFFGAAGGGYLVSSLDQTDSAPGSTAAPLSTGWNGTTTNGSQGQVMCSTTATFRYRTDSNSTFRLAALGFWHPRGKDA